MRIMEFKVEGGGMGGDGEFEMERGVVLEEIELKGKVLEVEGKD